MPGVRAILEGVTQLAAVAVRSFLGTMLAMTVLGVLLAGSCYYLLAPVHPAHAVVTAVLALLVSLAVGVPLAGRRAFIMALVQGLRTQRLGREAVRLVFDRLPGGAVVARVTERLPLAQAEKYLSQGVQTVLASPEGTGGGVKGWIRRRLQGLLLGRVSKYTLARFRDTQTSDGSVDVVKVRAELEDGIDTMLADNLRQRANQGTALVVVVLSAVVIGLAFLSRVLLA